MFLSACLAWLGVGALALASPRRVERLYASRSSRWWRRALSDGLRWPVRAAGWLLLLVSARPLAPEATPSLTVLAALLQAMAVASVAALLMPVRPRLYALSLPLTAAGAALALFRG
jgi:hypothetical protein